MQAGGLLPLPVWRVRPRGLLGGAGPAHAARLPLHPAVRTLWVVSASVGGSRGQRCPDAGQNCRGVATSSLSHSVGGSLHYIGIPSVPYHCPPLCRLPESYAVWMGHILSPEEVQARGCRSGSALQAGHALQLQAEATPCPSRNKGGPSSRRCRQALHLVGQRALPSWLPPRRLRHATTLSVSCTSTGKVWRGRSAVHR